MTSDQLIEANALAEEIESYGKALDLLTNTQAQILIEVRYTTAYREDSTEKLETQIDWLPIIKRIVMEKDEEARKKFKEFLTK